LTDAVIFKLVEQLEEPTLRPPVIFRVTEVVVPLSDPVTVSAMSGSPLMMIPPSWQLLMVSTTLAESEVDVSEKEPFTTMVPPEGH
jgi:hypothetical protein